MDSLLHFAASGGMPEESERTGAAVRRILVAPKEKRKREGGNEEPKLLAV